MTQSINTRQPGGGEAPPPAAPLVPRQRGTRLRRLLDARDHLAAQVDERRGHGHADAVTLHRRQLAVEAAIRDEFPRSYAHRIAVWCEAETAAVSHDEQPSPDCTFCRRAGLVPDADLPPAA
jgi:hypothetical protein